jgi:hypothetical protein
LETILVTNGYQFDLEGSVFRGRTGFGDESQLPCLGIYELRPEEGFRADETVQVDDWFLAIQGYVTADDTHPTDSADNLLADVKKCLGVVMRPDTPVSRNPNYFFGFGDDGISDMKIDGGVVFPPSTTEVTSAASFILRVTLKIVDEAEDPYA